MKLMKTIGGNVSENRIIHKQFSKSEVSWGFSDISISIGSMIDLFFVSAFIGVNGVTVLGFVAPLFSFIGLIGTLIASGARTKVNSLIGAGKLKESDRVFSDSLTLGTGISIIISLLVGIFSIGVANLLGANDPEVANMTSQYIIGYLIGFPFATLLRVLTPYLQIDGHYSFINKTAILTTVVDIVGDALVIFVFKGGMFEIGLATALGNIIPFFVGTVYCMAKKDSISFHYKFKGFSPKLCLDMIKLGAPNGISKGCTSLGGMLINKMLAGLNMPYLVAALSVFNQISSFLRVAWLAPADTLLAFVGVFVGEEDRNSIKFVQRIALIHGLIMTGIFTAILFFCNELVASVFLKTSDPEAFRLASECIKISCLSLPFNVIVYCFIDYLIGVKKIKAANVFSFISKLIIVPITFVMINLVGYTGAWYAKIVNVVVLTLIILIWILQNKEGTTFSEKMLLLPRDFGVSPDDEISIEATSTQEILHLSQDAITFAMEHGAEEEQANLYGLITEELSIFMSNHGFKDEEEHSVNARLVAKDGNLIIRMRDDCKLLNLKTYYEMVKEQNDPTHGDIGLSIIFKASKEVQYTSTFGANNLIIRM